MDDVFLIDDSKYAVAEGRYVVFGDNGEFVVQGESLDEVMDRAKAKGVKVPAIIDLELTQDRVYVF